MAHAEEYLAFSSVKCDTSRSVAAEKRTCLKRFSCTTRTSGSEDRLSDLMVPVWWQRHVGQYQRSLAPSCTQHRRGHHQQLNADHQRFNSCFPENLEKLLSALLAL